MLKRRQKWVFYGFLMCLGLPSLIWGQSAHIKFGQIDRPYVHITDTTLIRFFMNEFFITEEHVVAMDIVDISRNGFGDDDILITYPAHRTYKLGPSEAAQKIMNEWKFKAEFEKDSELKPPSFFDHLPEERAQNAILADLLRTLQRNYKDLPIQLRFSRDSTSFRFQIWDYNKNALQYHPPPPAAPDTIPTYDVVNVIHQEKLVEADTTYYDIVYVIQTLSDTLFVPGEKGRVRKTRVK